MEEKKDIMSFEEFREIMAESLIMNPEQLVPEAHFITDLAVDSIRFVELYLKFQEIGIEIPEDAVSMKKFPVHAHSKHDALTHYRYFPRVRPHVPRSGKPLRVPETSQTPRQFLP